MADLATEFTEEQKAQLPDIARRWEKWALSTERLDREKVEAGTRSIYTQVELKEPETIYWCDSPFAAEKLDKKLGATSSDSALPRYGWVSWMAWADTLHEWGGLERELLDKVIDAWSVPYAIYREDYAILCDLPLEIHREQVGPWGQWGSHRCHNENGPAILWPDGWKNYVWHGVIVEEWIVEDPTPEKIAAEPNIEMRRRAIESYGWDRYISHLGEPLDVSDDPGNDGQQLKLFNPLTQSSNDYILVVSNGSVEKDGTRRSYGISIPRRTIEELGHDAIACAAWTYDLSKEEYATVERRT